MRYKFIIPLKSNIKLNYIWRFSSYRTVNTVSVIIISQYVSVIWGNNHSLFWDWYNSCNAFPLPEHRIFNLDGTLDFEVVIWNILYNGSNNLHYVWHQIEIMMCLAQSRLQYNKIHQEQSSPVNSNTSTCILN